MRTRDTCRLETRPRDLWRNSGVKTVICRVVWEGVATGEYPTGDATIDSSWVIQRSKQYILWRLQLYREREYCKQTRQARCHRCPSPRLRTATSCEEALGLRVELFQYPNSYVTLTQAPRSALTNNKLTCTDNIYRTTRQPTAPHCSTVVSYISMIPFLEFPSEPREEPP